MSHPQPARARSATPTVSVLLAVYNGERFVEAAVRSVLAQSFDDFEMILVDDGSRDGSLAILERLSAEDSRVQLISRPNQGIPTTGNEMISRARGKYLSLMDHDDIMLPGCLAFEVDHLEAHERCVAVGVIDAHIDASGAVTKRRRKAENHFGPFKTITCRFDRCPPDITIINNPASMVRADAMRRAGGYREQFVLAHDSDLWHRLRAFGDIHRLNRVLLLYRRFGGNTSATARNTLWLYEIVSVLSAIARLHKLDDVALVAGFSGEPSFQATVAGYLDLIGDRYPVEAFLLSRAVRKGLPEVFGLKNFPALLRRALTFATSLPPSREKWHVLQVTARRGLAHHVSRRAD